MRLRLVTLAERPELSTAIRAADAAAYPEFLAHSDFRDRWPAVFELFGEFQLVLLDEVTGWPVAHANAVPFHWDGTAGGRPGRAVDAVAAAWADRRAGRAPTALCALQAVVHPLLQGRGLSVRALEGLAGLAAQAGLDDLIAPIRPRAKASHPHVPLAEYATWRRADGRSPDPWVRVHERLGAVPAGVAPAWLSVRASVERWRAWTGAPLAADGEHVVEGALVPLHVDLAAGVARYDEPRLWMRYAGLAGALAA